MIDLNKCIQCATDKDLNTTLTVKLEDGTTVQVNVCDEHAEDMTIKQARVLYAEKQEELQKIIEMAEAAGLKVEIPTASGLVVAQQDPAKVEKPKAPVPMKMADNPPEESAVKSPDTVLLNGRDAREKLGAAKSMSTALPQAGTMEQKQSHDVRTLEDKVDLGQEKIQLGLAEGRSGQAVPIPQIIKDEGGTTIIRVRQTVSDHDLQKNFKDLAESNDGSGNNAHSFHSAGYTMNACGFCSGSGFVTNVVNKTKQQSACPRCEGSGMNPK
jgi:hypothetical protein